jgi:hypothetical protein
MASRKGKANGQHHPVETDTNLSETTPATPANDTTATTADTIAPTEQIPWKDAVREGKEIVAREREDYLRLGELADKVEPKYGDSTLAKYAEAIGKEKSTLYHCRKTYRAWKGILPPVAKSTHPTVLEVLASLPDRVAIITAEPKMSKRRAEVYRELKKDPHRDEILTAHPNLTCAKSARKIANAYDDDAGATHDAGNGSGDSKRWFNRVLTLATDAIREAAVADNELTPEQQCDLLLAVEQDLLPKVRKAGEALIKLADFVTALCEEPPQAVLEEGKRRLQANAAKLDTPEEREAKERKQRAAQEAVAPADVIVPPVQETAHIQAMGA